MLFHSRFQSRAWHFARGHATCGWGTSCWDPNIPLGGASWPLPLCDIDINKRASTARTVWIVFHFCIDDRHSLSSERRAQISLSNFTHLFGLFPLDFLQLLSGHFHIYKNIAIDYIRTVEIHGRFADVFGRFFFIFFSLADRQTAYYYRVICGFGVSLYISSATEDSCSFLPMRYPRISIRRCVGRSGISSGHSLAVAQHLVTPAGNRRNRLCKRTRANYFIWSQAESSLESSFLNSAAWNKISWRCKKKISTEWWRHGGTLVIDEGTEEPSSSRK